MNRIAATTLVTKIQAIWPERAWSQTRTEQWVDAVQDLDERSADTTLRRLRTSSELCPSIAAFVTNAKPLALHTPEPDEYDLVAGAAAHTTFAALAATAETRADLANACFAAAAAYANASRKTLL